MIGVAERVIWGGRTRESALVWLLRRHYESVLRRQWRWVPEPPHYFDHRIGSFAFFAGSPGYAYYRGYFAAELVRHGDCVLEVGCGDGFFTRRFFATRADRVDALDVDAAAIAHARRFNSAPNVRYFLHDVVVDPFPASAYDVIVWDGGIGHFAPETTALVLAKIRSALTEGGALVGSEALGREGHDHLQFFDSLEELAKPLRKHFPHVEMRSLEYELPGSASRVEAFWRCGVNQVRLESAHWRSP